MKTFIALMIVAALGGAGYEYFVQGQETANYVQQRSFLTPRIDELTKQNKDLVDGNAALTAKLNGTTPVDTSATPAASTPAQ